MYKIRSHRYLRGDPAVLRFDEVQSTPHHKKERKKIMLHFGPKTSN